ncbi:alkyl hydroperoxide reductase subunit F [Aristophania vespae]|uniref:Thioredoxin reductase n=1 Tax=Aristophania vespae TaxID=2697033 RepID=A0A6P1N9F5_9PROT|nr:alkyl hydroperoxide reductase subunit F [Aristophania vespae]QHI95046.1 alkyl hydroperoxide reductase subunit F [Aristophania vespae]UMM64230.1 Alkyl hydroperoxide reductase subunit F [Aristophania vespae]
MLTDDLKIQLRGYLQHIRQNISLESSLGDDSKSVEMRNFLIEISELSDKIIFKEGGTNKHRPSFDIKRDRTDIGVTFAGIPLGHEFSSLILALLQVGGHPPKIEEAQKERILSLTGSYHFETYFSLSCHNCPDVVQALNTISVLNPAIRHTAIDGGLFPQEVEERDIRSVPQVFLNGEPFSTGRMDIEQILAKIDSAGIARAVESLNDEAPFDTLVVGSGPAGAAAAIYVARKGLRTGIVAERFGGQVVDTSGIENFISVPETEGPLLAQNLEQHVRRYDIRIMGSQRAAQLVPAKEEGALHEVILENGAHLKARTIIIATGARIRSLNVPGEDDYRTRGVAYCPHCDGPFFKGRSIAVAGGGNSGVEAAIDLAGIVSHVTLLQRSSVLKADQVLQDKLKTMPNVTVIKNAVTQKIVGDGKKMSGLVWKNKEDGSEQQLDVEGLFVQIGLDPNSDWVKNVLEISPAGEIVIDERCRTTVPGIFAAGDVTTVPYKQIVIAVGEGAKAALSAFDYMIRVPHKS